MFTVLSNTRNSSLYLIAALAIVAVVLLSFAVAPAISAPEPALVPVTAGISESLDYFQRHPELSMPAEITLDLASDFYQRHPELSISAGTSADMTDYFVRHPELRAPTENMDLSDYFLRH